MSFLETVVAEKRRGVAERSATVPMETLHARAASTGVRDFHAAVSKRGAVIAELKARTPTIESFAHSRDLLDLARTYEGNGAAAISIVTDPNRFGTSLGDVTRVRDAVSLPVIAKDFVIDPYQILEARVAGADAVLLIVRLLELPALRALLELTRDLGMAALVETHDETEVLAALTAGARIVGVNNRDLDTMTVSLDTARRLMHLIPDGKVRVAESGIRTRADVDTLAAAGATAFLVGGSLLDAPDPATTLRSLVGVTAPQENP